MMAKKSKKKASRSTLAFAGRMVMIGFGSIGQGVLPLIFRHIDIKPEQITVISAEDRGGLKEMKRFGVDFIKKRSPGEPAPDPRQAARQGRLPGQPLGRGRLDRAGRALPGEGALYIDTCIEPWPGGYTDPTCRSRCAPTTRCARPCWRSSPVPGRPTAVIAHGANPGLVSHFVKKALVNLAKDTGLGAVKPTTREGWGALARDLGVKVIHIAERDTQVSRSPRRSASSSTPGRSTASSRRAASRPRWAGARTRRRCRRTARATSSAAARRSTSTGRAW
jgi:homospermidine synthase